MNTPQTIQELHKKLAGLVAPFMQLDNTKPTFEDLMRLLYGKDSLDKLLDSGDHSEATAIVVKSWVRIVDRLPENDPLARAVKYTVENGKRWMRINGVEY